MASTCQKQVPAEGHSSIRQGLLQISESSTFRTSVYQGLLPVYEAILAVLVVFSRSPTAGVGQYTNNKQIFVLLPTRYNLWQFRPRRRGVVLSNIDTTITIWLPLNNYLYEYIQAYQTLDSLCLLPTNRSFSYTPNCKNKVSEKQNAPYVVKGMTRCYLTNVV